MDFALTVAALGSFFSLLLAWILMPQQGEHVVSSSTSAVVELPSTALSQAA